MSSGPGRPQRGCVAQPDRRRSGVAPTMETVKIGDGKGRGLVANAAALAQ
jgi:hypothetical protein